MKKFVLIALLLCFSFISPAYAKKQNWCGIYVEKDGRGYINIARDDVGIGSQTCNADQYQKNISGSGQAQIALEFTKERSSLNSWRKFSGHLIEVRGKFLNGYISRPRFVRGYGDYN